MTTLDQHLRAASSSQAFACKICGAPARLKFALPRAKLTGQPIPDAPDDCPYYECVRCAFLFCTLHDASDAQVLYDDDYWTQQDPDWHGRVNQTLRLVLLSNYLLGADPSRLQVLDYGCGMGCFVESARRDLQMQAFGTDLILPRFGRDWFVPVLPAAAYDIAVACEVVEHLTDPMRSFAAVARALRRPGVFAFQTAYYDRDACDRSWWYLGPANGHVSLFSADSLERAAAALGVRRRVTWGGYPGVQAWLFT